MTTTPTTLAQGAAWSLSSRAISQAIQFAASIALARLIAPEAFGLIGMVATVSAFLALVVDAGIGVAIMQRRDLPREVIDGAFALTVALGLGASALLVALAPGIAVFYGAPALTDVARASATGLLLTSIGVVPRALLVRNVRLGALAAIDLGATGISVALALALALAGAGVWALVASGVIAAGASSILLLLVGGWRPRVASISNARPLVAVGLHMLAFNAINYWARTVDNVLIGTWIGERELGLYLRAYALMLLPLTELISVLSSSVAPALARVQDDHPAVKAGYLKAVGVVALISFPAMVGLSLVAGPFVAVLYGPNWAGVAPILQVLALVGALQSIYSPVGWIYTSQGRTDRMFRWGVFATTVTIPALAYGAWLGSGVHVARMYLIANVAIFVPAYLYVGRIVGLRLRELGAAVGQSVAATAIMAAAVIAIGALLPDATRAGIRLAVEVAVGVGSYAAACRLVGNRAARDAADLVAEMRPGWRRWVLPITSLLAPPRDASKAHT